LAYNSKNHRLVRNLLITDKTHCFGCLGSENNILTDFTPHRESDFH